MTDRHDHHRSDDALGDLLRSLPRETARPGFTASVLERTTDADVRAAAEPRPALWARPRPRRQPRWLAGLAMAAALLLVVVLGWREIDRARELRATEARIAALRAEYESLARELAETRRIAERARPVVYLGGDESMAFHVDLATLARRQLELDRRAARAPSLYDDGSSVVRGARLDERSY